MLNLDLCYGKNAKDCVLSIHDLAYFAVCSIDLSRFRGCELKYSTAFLGCNLEQCFCTVLLSCVLSPWDLMPLFLPRHCMNHCRLGKMHRIFLSCMLAFRPQRNHQRKMHWAIFLPVSSIMSFKNRFFVSLHELYEVGRLETLSYIWAQPMHFLWIRYLVLFYLLWLSCYEYL